MKEEVAMKAKPDAAVMAEAAKMEAAVEAAMKAEAAARAEEAKQAEAARAAKADAGNEVEAVRKAKVATEAEAAMTAKAVNASRKEDVEKVGLEAVGDDGREATKKKAGLSLTDEVSSMEITVKRTNCSADSAVKSTASSLKAEPALQTEQGGANKRTAVMTAETPPTTQRKVDTGQLQPNGGEKKVRELTQPKKQPLVEQTAPTQSNLLAICKARNSTLQNLPATNAAALNSTRCSTKSAAKSGLMTQTQRLAASPYAAVQRRKIRSQITTRSTTPSTTPRVPTPSTKDSPARNIRSATASFRSTSVTDMSSTRRPTH
jgi:hypothetical protein